MFLQNKIKQTNKKKKKKKKKKNEISSKNSHWKYFYNL